ncbi:MAG: ATP-binding cassette domain-containing protein [Thermoleophilia bacterium]|nr:ATP-binding cassette domain-containing protein [Thermoleophilia bacterium]
MSSLLDIHNIRAFRGSTRVFDGFTLKIDEGCSTAVIGPNGAGKTTLLKLISGELRPVFSPDSHITVFGKERWNVWELRSHLGIVSYDLQHDYLADALAVNVVLSGFYSSMNTWQHQVFSHAQHCKAEETMDMLGVGTKKERPFGTLSTGEQRRLLLGRALVNEPRALLFDEPTSGLDLRASFRYRELLGELMRRGTTVLLVTHHIHEIPSEIQRVVLLKDGGIFADGSKEEMLTSERLSSLFDYPLHAMAHNGTYQVFPAG